MTHARPTPRTIYSKTTDLIKKKVKNKNGPPLREITGPGQAMLAIVVLVLGVCFDPNLIGNGEALGNPFRWQPVPKLLCSIHRRPTHRGTLG
jgi:hypothetical protein